MERLYSVRMRSSLKGRHVSGAERIVCAERLKDTVVMLLERAMTHPRGRADFVSIKVELLEEKPKEVTLLPVFEVEEDLSARDLLEDVFSLTSIGKKLGMRVYEEILKGPAPGSDVMRGAMIVDIESGRRLERDRHRGVRVSRMDVTPEVEEKLKEIAGKRYTENLKDALVLSTKVLLFPEVVGELCVSDDPDYTTGYLSLRGVGYIRIRNIKERGSLKGGRAIFVKNLRSLSAFEAFLEKSPVIATDVGPYSLISSEKLKGVISRAFSL